MEGPLKERAPDVPGFGTNFSESVMPVQEEIRPAVGNTVHLVDEGVVVAEVRVQIGVLQ